MSSHGYRGLQDLPAELLDIIFGFIDFYGFATLVRASAHIWRHVEVYPTPGRLFDRVLDGDDSIYVEVKNMIRIIARVRAGRLPITSLSEFERKIASHVIHEYEDNFPGMEPFWALDLPEGISAFLVRGLLMTASSLALGIQGCLDHYLAKLRTLRPRRPEDESFALRRRCMRLLRDAKPKYYLVEPPVQEEPPKWRENHIVALAFWRCQLVFDLKRTIRDGTLTGWPDEDIRVLRDSSVPMVYSMLKLQRTMSNEPDLTGNLFELGFPLSGHCMILCVLDYMHEVPLASLAIRHGGSPAPSPVELADQGLLGRDQAEEHQLDVHHSDVELSDEPWSEEDESLDDDEWDGWDTASPTPFGDSLDHHWSEGIDGVLNEKT